MPYLVVPINPKTKDEISLMDFLMYNVTSFDIGEPTKFQKTITRVVYYDHISRKKKKHFNFLAIIDSLKDYYEKYGYLHRGSEKYNAYISQGGEFTHNRKSRGLEVNQELYNTFYIPKASSKPGATKWRKIDAPCVELHEALSELKRMLESLMGGCTYHTNAFAYVPGRSVKDAVQKHADNKSKWILKLDFSNFFGSITLDFVMRALSDIFPFSEIVKYHDGYESLKKCLEIGFLDGGLPQGTPLSPLLTNIAMIGVDHKITRGLEKRPEISPVTNTKCRYIYTRYADDIYISNRVKFDYKEIMKCVEKVLRYYDAPFSINQKKTRFASTAGENWMLGLMYNEKGSVTVGHKRKKVLKAMLTNYMLDRKSGNPWSIEDVQHLQGEISYCESIEKEKITKLILTYSKKYGDIRSAIHADLSA